MSIFCFQPKCPVKDSLWRHSSISFLKVFFPPSVLPSLLDNVIRNLVQKQFGRPQYFWLSNPFQPVKLGILFYYLLQVDWALGRIWKIFRQHKSHDSIRLRRRMIFLWSMFKIMFRILNHRVGGTNFLRKGIKEKVSKQLFSYFGIIIALFWVIFNDFVCR